MRVVLLSIDFGLFRKGEENKSAICIIANGTLKHGLLCELDKATLILYVQIISCPTQAVNAKGKKSLFRLR